MVVQAFRAVLRNLRLVHFHKARVFAAYEPYLYHYSFAGIIYRFAFSCG
jgi:hypothetical protein